MHPRRLARFVLPLAAVLVVACGGASAGWSFAPLGPTAPPTASTGPTPAPSGSGLALETKSTGVNLTFEPNTLEAPANTAVTVNYLNDSTLVHNIAFLNGPDQTAPVLAQTDIPDHPGPGDNQSVSFTTPATPGDYFFYCQVHGAAMSGTLHVTAQ